MERVLNTLDFREPDRVPLFLLLTMHGARELGMPLTTYFSKPENIAKAQIRMQKKYRNDVLVPYYYSAIEMHIWGGDVITREDGPAMAGGPIVSDIEHIDVLEVPDIAKSSEARKTLESIEMLRVETNDTIPILAITVSPFSLPVMQLGFENYFELMFNHKERFWKLIKLNEEFSAAWIKAQTDAGAHAVTYFDPVSSPTIIPLDQYLSSGLPIASEMIPRFQAAVAFHLASARTLSIMEYIIESGAKVMSVSHEEDLAECKRKSNGRIALIGNLNGVEMRKWTEKETKRKVKSAIYKAATGGGFILSDSHGEVPFQVSEETLKTISDSVSSWGTYPIHV
jgi:uroporphyrinogen decarboxylase